MPSGGKRANAGRRCSLTLKQRLQIGAACERDWLRAFTHGTRPYRWRQHIIHRHIYRVKQQFDVELSERTVVSYWASFRKQRVALAPF